MLDTFDLFRLLAKAVVRDCIATQSPYLSQQDFTHTPYTSGGVGSPDAATAAGEELILAPGFAARKNKVTELGGLKALGNVGFLKRSWVLQN